jgi:hypothetical protein
VLHVQLREGDLSSCRVATGKYLHKTQNVEKEEAENMMEQNRKNSSYVWCPCQIHRRQCMSRFVETSSN